MFESPPSAVSRINATAEEFPGQFLQSTPLVLQVAKCFFRCYYRETECVYKVINIQLFLFTFARYISHILRESLITFLSHFSSI